MAGGFGMASMKRRKFLGVSFTRCGAVSRLDIGRVNIYLKFGGCHYLFGRLFWVSE